MNFYLFFLLFAHLALAGAQDQPFPSQPLLRGNPSFEGRRDLGWNSFIKWVQKGWSETIKFVEHVADVTGIDNIVHIFTDGDRIFNLDGSYNNELLENAVADAVVAIEDVFSETGLDKLVHKVTGGCRFLNRDGTYNNGCVEDLQDLTLDVVLDPLIDQAQEIWEDIQKGGNAVLDFVKENAITSQEADFIEEVLTGEVNFNNAVHRQELGNLLQDRILKVVEEIRYGIGFVDGQRPVVVFGTGLDCSASYVISGGASLNAFSKIPVFPGELQEVSITSSVAVGVGASAGASCGTPYHFSFNTDPSDMAGLGVTVSITAVKFGGIQVDFGFALMDNNRFKLATISVSPQAGAEFGITGALTYTSVLHTIKDIPIDPVSDQIEKPAAWCANENGICECDGFVRYGFGEKWNVMETAIDGEIGCNNHEFGDPFVGQRKICQCIPRIYGDHGFHFDLRGDEGNEIVTITDGGETRAYRLSTSWKTFSASNANIVIRFTNDMGSNDVFIRSKTPADIRSDELFGGWKCGWKVNGESIENHRCELVRQGGFYWKADYQIEFKRSTDNLVQEKAPGVGGWGGSCTCPDGSVYQVGDNFNHCGSMACIGGVSGTCNRYHGEWSYRKVTCGVPVKTEDIEYKLFPGAKCGSGFEPITSSWQDCEKAGRAIGLTGDAVAHVAYNYPWGTARPQGCFRSDGNNRIHFNRQAGGNAQGNDRILCKSASCPSIQSNVDYPGNDLNAGGMWGRVPGHLTLAQCDAWCRNDARCVGYTFVKSEKTRDNCAVKASWKESSRRAGSSCCDSRQITNSC